MRYVAIVLLVGSVGCLAAETAPEPEKKVEQEAPRERKHGMFSHVFKHMIGGTISRGLQDGAEKIKHGIGGEKSSEASPPVPSKKEGTSPLYREPKRSMAICMD